MGSFLTKQAGRLTSNAVENEPAPSQPCPGIRLEIYSQPASLICEHPSNDMIDKNQMNEAFFIR